MQSFHPLGVPIAVTLHLKCYIVSCIGPACCIALASRGPAGYVASRAPCCGNKYMASTCAAYLLRIVLELNLSTMYFCDGGRQGLIG